MHPKELTQWLESHRNEIELGELVVFFQDECHFLWGDICGYVWSKKNERVEVPIVNDKERQTYLGAVNIASGQCLLQAYPKGNGEHTIEDLKYPEMLNPDTKLYISRYSKTKQVKISTKHELLKPMNKTNFLTHTSLKIANFI